MTEESQAESAALVRIFAAGIVTIFLDKPKRPEISLKSCHNCGDAENVEKNDETVTQRGIRLFSVVGFGGALRRGIYQNRRYLRAERDSEKLS